MKRRSGLAELIVEFLGVFALAFIGAGTIIATGGQNLVAIAFVHGLAIAVMIAAAGHISGGVYNPAVAAALMASGKMPVARGLAFIAAEVLGGIVAALLLRLIFPAARTDAVNLGTPLPGDGVSAVQALLVEIVLTFFLVFVIFGVAIDRRGAANIAGLAIGLTITIDILMGGAVSGAAMNPARHFGTALVQGAWRDAWVYWVGPILGGVAAALLYTFALMNTGGADEQAIDLPQG